MVEIRGVKNYPSYHFALRARLIICPPEAGHHCAKGSLPAKIVVAHKIRVETGI